MATQNEKDVRDQIIEAATRLYIRYGLKKTTMEDIATEAGKGKATLYYYFKSKYDVFSSVIDLQTQEVRNKLDQILKTKDSASEMLEVYVREMIATAKEKVSIFRFLQMDIREDPKLIEEIRARFRDADTDHVKMIVDLGVKRKEFRDMDADEIETVADVISTALMGLSIRFLDNPNDQLSPERVTSVIEFFNRSLKV